MAVGPSIDLSGWLEDQLAQASPDLLRGMVKSFAEALMGAEADAICGARYRERSEERVTKRNGYRAREWDTRAVGVPAHGLPVGGEPTTEPVEIVDEDTGMPFADQAKVILDTEVDFRPASGSQRARHHSH
jgi:Transposase, Mutator family